MNLRSFWRTFATIMACAAIAACYLVVLTREAEQLDPETETVRFAHRLLDAGVREALDQVARDYERLQAARGRKVRVEQIAVPSSTYRQWLRTQLIGGTAPDLIEIETNAFEDEIIGQYFQSIGGEIQLPNPYNEGTPLEGLRWRDTIVDGMHVSGFNFRMANHYGVPFTFPTYRLIANRQLLESVVAENEPLRQALAPGLKPRSFEDFMALCRAAQAYAERHGLEFTPLITGGFTGRMRADSWLLDTMFQSQTQRIAVEEWDIDFAYRTVLAPALVEFAIGKRSLDNPAFRSGFALMREIAEFLPPGFLQMRREDAVFLFSQERALMMVATAADFSNLRSLIGDRFEIEVFEMPTPTPDTPVYGEYVIGPLTEARLSVGSSLALVSLHPPKQRELALDFLRYLTSWHGGTTFSRTSGWLSATMEVPVPPEAQPFAPRLTGYDAGPLAYFFHFELRRALETRMHLLFGPDGGVDRFIEATEEPFQEAAIAGLRTFIRDARRNMARQDVLIAAHQALLRHAPEQEAFLRRRIEQYIDSNTDESEWLFNRDQLDPLLKEIDLE